ncbi:slipin family protein [Eggerthella sp. NSJ-70]|uniref:Slipin family protein n=1 Tax=Eggerthella hominis TaxID=2763043 RepID=A0ABR7BS57_9ACTN|nr:slipin family protein [Eggerthella hominis]MBC5584431.1 slipin family protein [Eggerthella hominis]
MRQTDGVSRERRSRSFESAGSSFEIEENRANRNGSYLFSLLLFAVGFAVVGLLLSLVLDPVVAAVAALVAAVFAASSVRVAMSWERVVITRLGTVQRVVGPGLYCVIPFVESASMSVDQRIITTSFTAEEALTSDLVPVDVDAVVFWMVWNAKKACMEVQDYPLAVAWAAQTALRDAIGRTELSDLATRRQQLDAELQKTLDEKSQDWGITIASVEIRNIIVPAELQDALSKEAQAEREKNARILLAEVEKDISEMFVEAAETYDRNEKALHLRTLSAVAESTREKGGLVIAPSSIGDVFANLDAFSK